MLRTNQLFEIDMHSNGIPFFCRRLRMAKLTLLRPRHRSFLPAVMPVQAVAVAVAAAASFSLTRSLAISIRRDGSLPLPFSSISLSTFGCGLALGAGTGRSRRAGSVTASRAAF